MQQPTLMGVVHRSGDGRDQGCGFPDAIAQTSRLPPGSASASRKLNPFDQLHAE